MTDIETLRQLARNAGAHAALRLHGIKHASFVPGLTTRDEQEAADRAELLVPTPLTGPLADRGYSETVDSPGSVPQLPTPMNGHSYSPEERSVIMRTVMGRMGAVSRDRVERDNLAAGGHIRIASAPWTSGRLAMPGSGNAGQAPENGAITDYVPDFRTSDRSQLDPFMQADIGAGVARQPQRPAAMAQGRPQEELDADAFSDMMRRDALERHASKMKGTDPLADQREQQRMWGHSVTSDARWGPAVTSMASDPSSSPLGVTGVRP